MSHGFSAGLKIVSAITVILISALAVAYINRSNIIISALGFAQRTAFAVGPNFPINWANGGTWQGVAWHQAGQGARA